MRDREKLHKQLQPTFQNVRIIYIYPFLLSPIDFSNQLRNALEGKEVKNGVSFGEESVEHLKPSTFFYGPRFVKEIVKKWDIKSGKIEVGPFPGDFDHDECPEEPQWVPIPAKSLKLRGRLVVFYTGVGLADFQVDVEPLVSDTFNVKQVIAFSSWGEHFPVSVYRKEYWGDKRSDTIHLKTNNGQALYLHKIFEEQVECFRQELENNKKEFGSKIRFIDFRQAGFQELDKIIRLDSIPEKWQEEFKDFIPIVWRDGVPEMSGVEAKERFAWQIPYPLIILKTHEEVSSFADRYSVDISSILFKSLTPSQADMEFFEGHREALKKRLINMTANKKVFVKYSLKATVMLCESFEDNPSRYTIPSLRETLDLLMVEYYPLSVLDRLLDHEIWRMMKTKIGELGEKHLEWRQRLIRLKLYALSLVQDLVPLRMGTGSFKELYAVAVEKLRFEQLRQSVQYKVSQLDSLLQLILEITSLEAASKIDSRIKSLADGKYALTMLETYSRALESKEELNKLKERVLVIFQNLEKENKKKKG